MRYFGFDPGETSGLVVLEGDRFIHWQEHRDPVVLWRIIAHYWTYPGLNGGVLEDFIGQGILNVHRKQTIEVLGYIRYRCAEYGIPLEIVPQQKRNSCYHLVPAYIRGKDERSAAAHVLALKERKERRSDTAISPLD